MRKIAAAALIVVTGVAGAFGLLELWPLATPAAPTAVTADLKRGAYLARLGGCVACHTAENGEPFAGGVPLESQFGTFYSPNITPDEREGIGRWSFGDFARAMRHGVSPQDAPYYPAFPYEFYASFTDRDLADLWVALNEVPASGQPSRDHDVGFPFSFRNGLKLWKALFERPADFERVESKSVSWNRGRFIVEGPGHCAACHTPRNIAGGLDQGRNLAGNPQMMDGGSAPSLAAQDLRERGWTADSLAAALQTGILPNGDAFGGSMAEVVHEGTSYLLSAHRRDIAAYLMDSASR